MHKLAELPGCELLRPKMPGCDRCGSKCPVFRGGRFLIEVQAGSGTRRDPVKRYKPGTFLLELELAEKISHKNAGEWFIGGNTGEWLFWLSFVVNHPVNPGIPGC